MNRFSFEEAICDLEDFFIKSSDEELHGFILEAVEKPLIDMVLRRTDGNQVEAAKILGITQDTLSSKIKESGINPGVYR
ncbi:hypothetical protein KJ693_05090 [bacterium]|nr:hypothetical protein [bacterium]MBU1614673.1 hypothetical protein [bacterium]